MGFLKPSMPEVKDLPPAPRRDDAQIDAANQKRRLRSAQGFSSTVATGASGAIGSTKKLLGYG